MAVSLNLLHTLVTGDSAKTIKNIAKSLKFIVRKTKSKVNKV